MNKPLRRVAVAMMAMIVLLLANATYVQVIRADALRNHSGNSRTLYQQYSTPRGQIIADGKLLASSEPTGSERFEYKREYADGPAFAPATGYFSFVYGTGGVESAENEVLSGTSDSLALNRLQSMLTGQQQQGGNVELTLNPAMQQAAYQQLAGDGVRGSVVALNPRDGSILAMANSPSYDPNRLATLSSDDQQQAWNELSEAPDDPLVNRATSTLYPPGSTFKLITAAAALESGEYDYDSEVTAKSSIKLPKVDAQLPNYGGATCGTMPTAPLWEAMARSCNTAFAEVAGKVGEKKLRETARSFGFGRDLDVPMSVAPSSVGDIENQAQLYQSGIGQFNVRTTPMQNAMVAAAIANDGEVMKPHLVDKTLAPDMSVLDSTDSEELGRAVSPEIAHTIRDMMVKAEQYAGDEGKISGVQIASKTGTAEHGEGKDPHGWYVAFAPAEDPQIAVAAVVEDGGDVGASATGSKIAAPVARAVIRAGLQGGG
ncbi:penicillin-binding protein 2 [Actinopolyspora erythraea]|uniref:Penicillin-binding protein n=1 Tax=Actinopolyspora erythraea TaxID=414996 RepID=A0A099DAV3_9ACTN|nr:penicillin-binding protein 2 [Actinopolyspora erythraea]ASU77007.1 penicillin-binding protein 2 [Actinopolyspora erythraea]KGI82996.1 penicillin-binding protein [Actinopolyspora erythraea]